MKHELGGDEVALSPPSLWQHVAVDTIVSRLRHKFLPANYSMLVQLRITNFIAPSTMRPSSILDELRNLNRQFDGPAAFSDATLRTLFIKTLNPKIQEALVLDST